MECEKIQKRYCISVIRVFKYGEILSSELIRYICRAVGNYAYKVDTIYVD